MTTDNEWHPGDSKSKYATGKPDRAEFVHRHGATARSHEVLVTTRALAGGTHGISVKDRTVEVESRIPSCQE